MSVPVQTSWDRGHDLASAASMPNLRRVTEVKSPQPRSGASKTPGLRSVMRRESIRRAVLRRLHRTLSDESSADLYRAAHGAACRVVPVPGVDREPPTASPETTRMQPRQPPIRLPPQESDIRRFANPLSYQTRHFAPPVLHRRLSSA